MDETGRRLGDRFRELLRDVERNDKDASKPVAKYFNIPNHSTQHMAVCGLSLHLSTGSGSLKTLEQKFIFQIGALNPHGINERFSFNWFILVLPSSYLFTSIPFSAYKHTHNPQFLHSLWQKANTRNVSFKTLYGDQFTLSFQLITLNYPVILSHWRGIKVSLENYLLK